MTIGKYLITPHGADQHMLSWVAPEGRQNVRICHLEQYLEEIVNAHVVQLNEFVALFRCAMLGQVDDFLNQYPNFMDYVDDEPPGIDYVRESGEDKFNRQLFYFLKAFNFIHHSGWYPSDVLPMLDDVRQYFKGSK